MLGFRPIGLAARASRRTACIAQRTLARNAGDEPAMKGDRRRKEEERGLADRARITVTAGNGGNGCIAFLREKFRPKGGPAGGNGGKGGDIVIVASEKVADLRLRSFHYKAKSGEDGSGKSCNGRQGQDCVIFVPVGTQISAIVEGDEAERELRRAAISRAFVGTQAGGKKYLKIISDIKEGKVDPPFMGGGGGNLMEFESQGGGMEELKKMAKEERERRKKEKEAERAILEFEKKEGEGEGEEGGVAAAVEVEVEREGGRKGEGEEEFDVEEEMEDKKQVVHRKRQLFTDDMSHDAEDDESDAVLVHADEVDDAESDERIIPMGDLEQEGGKLIVAMGGRGGRGNLSFATRFNPAPRLKTDGERGQVLRLQLDLKLLAHIGLIGLPNAGKSTLLGAISNVKPKIGYYAFTTLRPWVGYLKFPDYFPLTVADLPGLVKGAHMNVGLGHRFLRHVERCKALAFVLDVSPDAPPPLSVLLDLREELRLYHPPLLELPAAIVANKVDMEGSKERLEQFKEEISRHDTLHAVPIVEVSGKEGINLNAIPPLFRSLVENKPYQY